LGELNTVVEPFEPRTMNRMDDDTKRVHVRLEQWGRWARNIGISAWPPITVLGRVMEEGPHGSLSIGKPPTTMPEAVAHCDAAVAKLGDVDRRVIRKYYIEWAPIEVMAKDLRMRESNFRAVLRRARWRISGYLAAIENANNI
jgi:hypothetical protein